MANNGSGCNFVQVTPTYPTSGITVSTNTTASTTAVYTIGNSTNWYDYARYYLYNTNWRL